MARDGALQTTLLTVVALLAFAANSLLCRMALGARAIDPLSFTCVRLCAGALVLWPLAKAAAPGVALARAGTWRSALALFGYAIAFSWAYVALNTATGALILFASVQCTMIAVGIASGERLGFAQAAGVAMAASGLGYLLLPGASAPSPGSAALMVAAGSAWGLYTLWGRGAAQPLVITAGNFARATLPAVLAAALGAARLHVSPRGVALAAVSGAVTSGLGYAIWYRALRGLTATQAAILQLSVPVIAAVGAVAVLHESVNPRLAISSVAVIGGVALVLSARR